MATHESGAVDVWILSFELSAEDAAEGIAWAFEMELPRAAALVASVPRVVRRGVAPDEAEETAEALRRAGAEVELCASDTLPAALEHAAPSVEGGAETPRGPRVQLKRALAATGPAAAPLTGDEPAYGMGSSAYVPVAPPPRRAPAPRGVHVPPPQALDARAPRVDADQSDAAAHDDDLELGSLIPAPMRAPAPASLRPPSMPVPAPSAPSVPPPASGEPPADAPNADDLQALQAALASLPQVKPAPRASHVAAPPARSAPHAHGASVAKPVSVPLTEPPRSRWPLVGGALVLLGVALALGRAALSPEPADVPSEVSSSASAAPTLALSDTQLLAATADFVSLDARTWLRLGERNHFGDMSAGDSRAFLDRLTAAGALTANVGLPTDAAVRAGVLVIQHSPLHRDALMEAATTHPGGPVVPAACIQTGQRYLLIRLDGCPERGARAP